jgi:hypothetical protein
MKRTEESLPLWRATSSALVSQSCPRYFLVIFEGLTLAAFFAAGLAELPHGFLDAHPPFCAMLFTLFHFRIRSSPLHLGKQTKDIVQAGYSHYCRCWAMIVK